MRPLAYCLRGLHPQSSGPGCMQESIVAHASVPLRASRTNLVRRLLGGPRNPQPDMPLPGATNGPLGPLGPRARGGVTGGQVPLRQCLRPLWGRPVSTCRW